MARRLVMRRQLETVMGKPPPDSFEFELTDFDDARRALEELPPGVGGTASLAPGYWEGRRRKTAPGDMALKGFAIEWLLALPGDVRPKLMCDRFPRIVNQIAECWPDRAQTATGLRNLLADERGGRRGFGVEVQAEIARLLQHALAQAAGGLGNPAGPVR